MFSSAIVLDDLNDFISPSQECIKPIPSTKTQSKADVKVSDEGRYYEVQKDGTEQALEEAKISLNDCLACSGCVTSAETVLIAMQHGDELLKALSNRNGRCFVVSLSSQSRASLASKWGMNSMQIWNALAHFFKSHLGVDHVFDIDYARDLTLLQSGKDFLDRLRQSDRTTVLASSCPGWVCYAEKTHPAVLPMLDRTKSPQQVMGSIVKNYFATKMGLTPDQVYHVSVMPCYDKKLEASRQDFYDDVYNTRDVDLVLSTIEVEKLIKGAPFDFGQYASIPDQPTMFIKGNGVTLCRTNGSSSGGYLSWILRYAVKHLYGVHLSPQDIEEGRNGVEIKIGRNSDYKQVSYRPEGSLEATLRFAYVYGFRNIQNLVRKVKQNRGPVSFHFVEVMACPSGCINGGGQSRPEGFETKQVIPSEWIQSAEQVYRDVSLPLLDPDQNESVIQLYNEWIGGDVAKTVQFLQTEFRAVEAFKSASLAVQW